MAVGQVLRVDDDRAVIDAGLTRAIRLAETIQPWWQATMVALTEETCNEGFNRIIV